MSDSASVAGHSPRLCFISDLHLFSKRSTATLHHEMLVEAARDSDLVVLGGDLFDLRWSVHRDPVATIEHASRWVAHFLEEVPGVDCYFLSGNHDSEPALLREMGRLALSHPRFRLSGDVLQIGDTALLHGDVVDVAGCPDRLVGYRRRWAEKAARGAVASAAYDGAVGLRLHRLAAATAHRTPIVCRRVLRYLQRFGMTPETGLARVVFGHTHRRLVGFENGGVTFYNGGAAIRGVPFRPVVLPFSRDSAPQIITGPPPEGWPDPGETSSRGSRARR